MLDEIKIDQSKLDNGTWAQLKNSNFLIAHASNRAFKVALANLAEQGMLDDVSLDRLVAKHILRDWFDVKMPDGSDLPYSVDMAAYALSANKELREFVDKVSMDYSYFGDSNG